MDLSDPKTWTDGLGVVVSAPHIVVPLVIAVGSIVWWFRGTLDKSKIDRLQERLDGAKDQQSYLARKLDDAEAEIAKLEQQIEDRAAPELLRDTVNSTAQIIGEIATVNTRLGNTVSNPDLFNRRLEIYKVVKNCVEQVVRNPEYFGGDLERQFLNAINDADLFFGDDVYNYLQTLRKDIVRVRDASKFQTAGAEWPTEAMNRINKFGEEGQSLFAKYMPFVYPVT